MPFGVILLLPYAINAGKHILFSLHIRFLIPTVFHVLRVFALSNRNWMVSGLVLLLNLVPIIIGGVCLSVKARSIMH